MLFSIQKGQIVQTEQITLLVVKYYFVVVVWRTSKMLYVGSFHRKRSPFLSEEGSMYSYTGCGRAQSLLLYAGGWYPPLQSRHIVDLTYRALCPLSHYRDSSPKVRAIYKLRTSKMREIVWVFYHQKTTRCCERDLAYLHNSSNSAKVSAKDFATIWNGSSLVRSTPATLSSDTGSILPPSPRNFL